MLEHTSRVMCARQVSGTRAQRRAVPSREQRTVGAARETRTEVETSRRIGKGACLPADDRVRRRRHGWPPAASLCRFSRLSFSPRERCLSLIFPFTSKPRYVAPLEDFATLLAWPAAPRW